MSAKGSWWSQLYDDLLDDMLLERQSAAETNATLDFIQRQLELASGARVFDQCCGTGSLALPLAERGFRVIGVDQAGAYVEKANGLAARSGLTAGFVEADAFEYVPEPCAGAFNWWTSFGYALDDATNLKMLKCAHKALLPGASFLLDTLNLPGVFRHFQRDVVTQRETRRGLVTLHRKSSFDLAHGRILKTWTYFVPEQAPVMHETSVRLYLPSTLREMLLSAGFESVTLLGDVDERPLDIDCLRCICVARRGDRD